MKSEKLSYTDDIRNNQRKKIAEEIADMIVTEPGIARLAIYQHLKQGEDLASNMALHLEEKTWNANKHKPDNELTTQEEAFVVPHCNKSAVDRYIKKDLKHEVLQIMTEIDLRFRRFESLKGATATKNDKM